MIPSKIAYQFWRLILTKTIRFRLVAANQLYHSQQSCIYDPMSRCSEHFHVPISVWWTHFPRNRRIGTHKTHTEKVSNQFHTNALLNQNNVIITNDCSMAQHSLVASLMRLHPCNVFCRCFWHRANRPLDYASAHVPNWRNTNGLHREHLCTWSVWRLVIVAWKLRKKQENEKRIEHTIIPLT